MKLDLTSLEKSVSQLRKSLNYCHSDLAKKNEELFFQFRSAAIQAFEYTFELAIKMLRRQLEEIELPPIIEQMSYRDFIRMAAEKGFIESPKDWFLFREKRNLTSHVYDEEKAKLVYAPLEGFLKHVQILLTRLQTYNH